MNGVSEKLLSLSGKGVDVTAARGDDLVSMS